MVVEDILYGALLKVCACAVNAGFGYITAFVNNVTALHCHTFSALPNLKRAGGADCMAPGKPGLISPISLLAVCIGRLLLLTMKGSLGIQLDHK